MRNGFHQLISHAVYSAAWVPVTLTALTGCFNSDDLNIRAPAEPPVFQKLDSTTPTPQSTPTPAPPPDVTCRDAIDCVQRCAVSLSENEDVEPDLTCFLDCEHGLDENEALALLRLSSCASDRCLGTGECEDEEIGTSTTGGSVPTVPTDTTGTETPADTTSTTTTQPPMPTQSEVCMTCILATMHDIQPPGCLEEAQSWK